MTIKSSHKSPLLTANIKIRGHGATEIGEPFVRLEIKGKRVLVRVNNLLGNSNIEFARLQNYGARLLHRKAQNELISRIETALREPVTFDVATTLGWRGEVFVFPDAIVPAGWSDVEIYLQDDNADIYRRFRCHGTRAGTMQLFALFTGNSRLMFGSGLAGVGALSPVINPEHVAVEFVDDPGNGKTSSAVAISSFWGGDPDPNHRLGSGTSWKNTDYALEKYAAAYNNMLLFLDEADSAEGDDPKATANSLLKAIKDISGGKGKGRGNDSEVRTSFTPILSTSNASVPQMLVMTKRRVDDFSYIDRLLDIPAPVGGHGFFENLHGFSDLAKFRDRLIELASLHYGSAGRAYVWHIAHALRNDRDEFVAFVKGRREQYQQAVADMKAPGRKLLRVHGKFATVYAAGCVAIRFKIFPFTEAAMLDAVMTCERDHIAFIAEELGGVYALSASQRAAAPPRTPYEVLKHYVFGPKRASFVDLRAPGALPLRGHSHAKCPGYLGRHRGQDEVWIRDTLIEQLVGGRSAARAVKSELEVKGLIVIEGQGANKKYVVKRKIPGVGIVRVVALRLKPFPVAVPRKRPRSG